MSLRLAGQSARGCVPRLGSVKKLPRYSRGIFTVPELPHLDKAKGIPGLLSKEGLDVAWFQYQNYLIKQLNELTKDVSTEGWTLYNVMLRSYTDPNLRPLSYYASQAYNNQFFFESLDSSADPSAKIGPPSNKDRHVDISTTLVNAPRDSDPDHEVLLKAIGRSFNDTVTLKELLLNRADAMFGNGYVWLVSTRHKGSFNPNHTLYVLNTYNYDTPFSRETKVDSEAQESADAFGLGGSQAVTNMVPLLNINAWQHVYLTDYGVAGKRKFLENAFNCINWDIVANRLPSSTPIFKR